MHDLGRRLQREFVTMDRMVALYCRAHHAPGAAGTCPQCREFLAYAAERLAKCPYGDAKPTCANCPVHCYKKAPRELVHVVMRYAGPRMLWRHPLLAVAHLLDGRRRVPPPMEFRRARRADGDPRPR